MLHHMFDVPTMSSASFGGRGVSRLMDGWSLFGALPVVSAESVLGLHDGVVDVFVGVLDGPVLVEDDPGAVGVQTYLRRVVDGGC